MRSHHQVAFLAQQQRHVRNLKCLLNDRTGADQEVLEFHHRGALLRDLVDGLQLTGALPLQRVQAGVLQSDGGLGGEQRQ